MTGLLDRPAAVGPLITDLVQVRPSRPADAAAVRAFLTGLSADSAYRRFLPGLGAPSAAFLRRFVEVDHHRREVLLGLLGDQVIALADWAGQDDGETIEIGLVVTDAWQRLGLGTMLAGELLALAVARGARTVRVHALADNARVARMVRRRWPDCAAVFEAGTMVWTLPLLR